MHSPKEINVFNIAKQKKLTLHIGVVNALNDIDSYQILEILSIDEQDKLYKREVFNGNTELGINVGDIILWNPKASFFILDDILVPIRSKDKSSYKISSPDLKAIFKEKKTILSRYEEYISQLKR